MTLRSLMVLYHRTAEKSTANQVENQKTSVSDVQKANKMSSSQFMHKLYAVVEYQGAPFLAKITVEEYEVNKKRAARLTQSHRELTLSRLPQLVYQICLTLSIPHIRVFFQTMFFLRLVKHAILKVDTRTRCCILKT